MKMYHRILLAAEEAIHEAEYWRANDGGLTGAACDLIFMADKAKELITADPDQIMEVADRRFRLAGTAAESRLWGTVWDAAHDESMST